MSKQEAKTRCTLLLQNLGNNFNFSSIAEIKDFTNTMIDKHCRSDHRDIGEKYINFAEYFIVKKLMAREDFELPDFETAGLDIYFPDKLTSKLILERRDEEMKNFIKKEYAGHFGQEKAQDILDELYNPENFKNIEEGPRANAPQALFIPKFINKTATAGLGQQ